LRDGLKRIRQELGEHFADLDDQDVYSKQMWSFSSKANEQVEDLVHDVNNAESTFIDVISYYGEDEKKDDILRVLRDLQNVYNLI